MLYRIEQIVFQCQPILVDAGWKKFLTDQIECVSIKVWFVPEIYRGYGFCQAELPYQPCACFKSGRDVMFADKDWGNIWVFQEVEQSNLAMFLVQAFYSHAIQRHIIQMHSSLIATSDNQGIMFLGPSGIGKTTQAELWNKYLNALIINGDMVFVQETLDDFLGWGTPWHGSSPYCENTSVPLKAMIVLKQAPENSIRELTGFEKVSAVSNNVFYPTWLEKGMELCLETLDHLLSRIPVYELSCRPDEEAVKLTEETIFGSSSVSD